ncbi:hypothetical protein NNRS527_00552 [Nitrosospira sp. NRS527]|nr:hypothetical protein NNRS527_00552 [Nitrosospira sp. NRS527]
MLLIDFANSLYLMFYNSCKIHKSLRVTPAMEADLTCHVWSMTKVVATIPEE